MYIFWYLDYQFPEAWIGRRGLPDPPISHPLISIFGGTLKAMVYQVKIRDINKSSQGTYRQRHYKHNFNCANACSSTVKNKH